MRIATLRLKNWLSYAGEHELALGSGPHAVVARYASDPDASNGAGKTALLEAVRFALYGDHRHRTEDAWISRGEAKGEVDLVTTTGHRFLRTRERGKRTTFYAFAPNAAAAMREEAERVVREAVGLGEEDFPHVAQRHAARLLNARPEERMQVVGAWLRLGPLEACEGDARDLAGRLGANLAVVEARITAAVAAMGEMNEVTLEQRLASAEAALAQADGELAAAQEELEANAERVDAERARGELAEVVAEGQALRAEVDRLDPKAARAVADEAEERRREARSQLDDASRRVRARLQVAAGAFDGRCPVAGRECPVADEINAGRDVAQRAVEEARRAEDLARKVHREVEDTMARRQAEAQEVVRKEARLGALREQARRLQDRARANIARPDDPDALRSACEKASRRRDDALESVLAARTALAAWREAKTLLGALEAEQTRIRAGLATAQAAAKVFGRSGAQRKVAETAMGRVEAGANAALAAAGSALTLAVRWSQEGSGPARACDACGAPFPASAKVKACERCQAARGLNLMHRLDFDLSDRSGGLEDLAGVALSLSAAAWLRRERNVAWSCALVDEPFAMLDRSARRGLGAHLAGMLAGEYGFEQALVVAHQQEVLDAMPARIEVTRDAAGRSSCRVA